jgi:hypothetical protein
LGGLLLPLKRRLRAEIMKIAAILLGYRSSGHHEIELDESHIYARTTPGSDLEAIHRGYLRPQGWIKSRQLRKSVDAQGLPIPWLTYSSVHFLETLNRRKMSVLEFGGGASTAWFSKFFGSVVCIEADSTYRAKIQSIVGPNAVVTDFNEIIASPDALNVPIELLDFDRKEIPLSDIDEFLRKLATVGQMVRAADLILIDGGPRSVYLWLASQFCRNDSILVVDNTDQPYTQPGLAFFDSARFLRIPFSGLSPMNSYVGETSVLIAIAGLRSNKHLARSTELKKVPK